MDYRLGGLKLIDNSVFTHALKSSWILRLLLSNAKWTYILEAKMKIKINDLWVKGSDYILKYSKNMGNKFWSEVFLSYMKISEIICKNTNPLLKHIWCNPRIRINNESIFLRSFLNAGIIYIIDLFDIDG